MILDTILLTDI